MIKLVWRLLLLVAIAAVFAWLADRPEKVTVQWSGKEFEMSVLVAVAFLAIAMTALYFVWRFLSRLWRSPSTAREYWRFRKHRKAYESLSQGMIAASAGDAHAANRHAAVASKTLDNEPLTHVLAAQAAQLKGDRDAVKRAFEQMAKQPATEVLGLRGLFTEAKQSGDLSAAIQFAEKALALNPRLAWASSAMLQIQSARKDWQAAANTILTQGKSGLLQRAEADRKRAALLTAEAIAAEDTDRPRALSLANDAINLDPTLTPPAVVAARIQIANGNTRKAVKILREAWNKSQHPDIADVMAHARPGDGPEERYERVRDLAGDTEENLEGAVALAKSAIAAKRWDVARKTLEPHAKDRPQARVCALMAEVEEATGDKGRAREWLARALTAPRDPMWVSDGVASTRWTPVSPVTGEIVPCEWKPPFDLPYAQPMQITEETQTAEPVLISSPASAIQRSDAVSVSPPRPDDPGVNVDPA